MILLSIFKETNRSLNQTLYTGLLELCRLAALNSRLIGIKVGDFCYVKEGLVLGQLMGNRFTITLRGVVAEYFTRGVVAESQDIVKAAADGLSRNGFINYYGLQYRMAGLAAIEKGEMEDEHEKAEEDDAHANDQDDDGAVRTQDQLKAAGLEDSDAEDDMVAPSNKKWRAWSSDEDNDDEPSGRHHDLSPAGRKEDLAGSDPDDARDTEMRDEMHEPNMGTGDEDDD